MSSLLYYTGCPACGSTDHKAVLTAKDHGVSGEEFVIHECNACQLRFTQGVPDRAAIAPYYQFEDYISHTNKQSGIISYVYRLVRQLTLHQKRRLIERQTGLRVGTLLDVGAGTGAFAAKMQKAGWQVTALEPDAGARRVALETFGVTLDPIEAFDRLLPAQFDVITLWHVLEHMHDLQSTLAQLKRLLKPNGKILIAVPNPTSYDAQLWGNHWAAYDVPRHLYHFSPAALRSSLVRHQWSLSDIVPMWFDSFYVSLLSSRYRYGSTRYGKAFLVGMVSVLKAMADKERCSSLIYVAS